MARIADDGDYMLKPAFLQSCFHIKGVVVIAPGFGTFHQSKEDRRQVLNDGRLRIVVDYCQTAAGPQQPMGFAKDGLGNVARQLVNDKL